MHKAVTHNEAIVANLYSLNLFEFTIKRLLNLLKTASFNTHRHFCVVGPSGSGKTMIMALYAQLCDVKMYFPDSAKAIDGCPHVTNGGQQTITYLDEALILELGKTKLIALMNEKRVCLDFDLTNWRAETTSSKYRAIRSLILQSSTQKRTFSKILPHHRRS